MKANRNFYGYALSLSRVPRQLPPGGSLNLDLLYNNLIRLLRSHQPLVGRLKLVFATKRK